MQRTATQQSAECLKTLGIATTFVGYSRKPQAPGVRHKRRQAAGRTVATGPFHRPRRPDAPFRHHPVRLPHLLAAVVVLLAALTLFTPAFAQDTGICDRTEAVRDALVAAIASVNVCADVTTTQLAGVTRLYLHNSSLTTLKAGDFDGLTALTTLNLNSNQLTSLDMSNNTTLTELYLGSNQLTSLDLSNNTALKALNLNSNQLTSLDLSNNTALTHLYLEDNQLTSLDLSNTTTLTELNLNSNQLTSLDLSNNTALKVLYLEDNQLTSLDLSNNTALIAGLLRHGLRRHQVHR